MPENYDHYISKNIKAFYKRRLAAPIIYLIVLILAWHFFSLSAVFSPDILPDDTSLETAFRGGKQYISTTLSDLKFTGLYPVHLRSHQRFIIITLCVTRNVSSYCYRQIPVRRVCLPSKKSPSKERFQREMKISTPCFPICPPI